MSLMEMYRKKTSSCKNDFTSFVDHGTVHISQGFDFMKPKSRLQLLKILYKIGTIVQR